MPGAVWVQACAEGDFDTVTQTCAVPYWTAETTFQALTIEEAQGLFVKIALIFAIAWGWKKLRQFVETM